MMYSDLYRYLVRYNELPIPGVGTFSIERHAARLDFPSRKIHAPVYAVRFQHDSYLPGEHFFKWLGQVLGLTDREAVFRFNDFALGMKKDLEEGSRIIWFGVGELKKKANGEIGLEPSEPVREESLVAEKILREKSAHMVRVGEDQRSSVEMTALLGKEEIKKSSWWVPALALAILALMFIGWYLSENGLEINAVSNSTPFIPAETPASSYTIPE